MLIEDDSSVREGLRLSLSRHGHEVDVARTGEDGLRRLLTAPADIVVLDLMLPGIDGFEVCRRIRAGGPTPIVMLTARGDDLDVVSGLEAGADDYVIKPVRPRVLEARIRAVLRRGGPATETEPGSATGQEVHGDLTIDRGALTVSKGDVPITLPPMELRLLLELSAAYRQVFSRQQLLESVWELDFLGDSRLVDACVQRLRTKIEDVPSKPRYIQTVRGFGYRFGPL
ncbi:DNA-binding response regulator, OmpR family, contains REC and winged-helix (wHTH) domain [Streptosporangium subroseum]|uniref:DNA-binding response regulator, OmpR family, contains REC and winged-helix (WHTH) domain n=2 Tax=Streptosporangium subroseum TaxID=106412 RepID=A0A239NPN2_9ACTN|nr:DNA-binding response regulator, OmpR family, contains REC and winged-helix (wHTH) domain [Streptosporangium subroseum]